MGEQIRGEQVVVAANEAGERLDRVLAARTALSRSRLKALILDGAVAIGTRTIRDPGYRVNAGDEIGVDLPPPEPAEPAAERIPLNVVYEDTDDFAQDGIVNAQDPVGGSQAEPNTIVTLFVGRFVETETTTTP